MSLPTNSLKQSATTPPTSSQQHSTEEAKNFPANDSSINTLQIRQQGLKRFSEAVAKDPLA